MITAPAAGHGAGLPSTWATMIMITMKLTIFHQQKYLPSTLIAIMITIKMTIMHQQHANRSCKYMSNIIKYHKMITMKMTIVMTARTTGVVFPHLPLGKPGQASLMTPTGWNSKRFFFHHQCFFLVMIIMIIIDHIIFPVFKLKRFTRKWTTST